MPDDVSTNPIAGTKVAEVRMNVRRATLIALGLGIPLNLACLWLALALVDYADIFSVTDFLIAFALFVVVGIVHEFLHGVAAVLHGRLRWRDVHFGVYGKGFALACEVKVPVRVRTARIISIAPTVVLGPLAAAALIAFPSSATAMILGFTLVGATMDLLVLHKLRRFDGNLLFVDHPKEPAFDLYAPPPAETIRETPDFKLQDQDGKSVGLSDFKGRKVLLYFYPKASTSG